MRFVQLLVLMLFALVFVLGDFYWYFLLPLLTAAFIYNHHLIRSQKQMTLHIQTRGKIKVFNANAFSEAHKLASLSYWQLPFMLAVKVKFQDSVRPLSVVLLRHRLGPQSYAQVVSALSQFELSEVKT